MKRFLAAAVCTILSACATTPPKPEPVPPDLVPAGFSAADCRVTDSGGPITDNGGPNGVARQVGTRAPKVECSHHSDGPMTVTSTPTCHSRAGKELPLSDCCMTAAGTPIPQCTPKIQPPGE